MTENNIQKIEKSKYLDLKMFKQKSLDCIPYDKKMNEEESISLELMESTVEYMSKFLYLANNGETIDSSLSKAFKPAFLGIDIMFDISDIYGKETDVFMNHIMKDISGLETPSLIAACRLASYDIWFKNPHNAIINHEPSGIRLDEKTLENLRIMILRSLSFFDKYGPITEYDFTSKTGGMSFLTKDTIWDFNIYKDDISSKDALQLLTYYLMVKHSKEMFKDVKKLGFFNPRKGIVYTLNIDRIPNKLITSIKKEIVCCYGKRK